MLKKFTKPMAIVMCVCLLLLVGTACGGQSSAAPSKAASSQAAPSQAASTAPSASSEVSSTATTDWPKGNITLICPFKAGGGMDTASRLIAQFLEKDLGVTVTVNNVEGGNSWTGWMQVNAAKPDGYTLGFANYPAQVGGYLNPSANVKLTYRDFTAVCNIVSDYNCIVTRNEETRFKTGKEFMEYAKENEVTVGTGGGTGSDDHVLIEKINNAFGTKLKATLMASTAEAKAAMLGGHIDAVIGNVSEYYALSQDKSANVLAVCAPKRAEKFMPDIPTLEEQGYADVYGASDRGLIAPPNLDPAVMEKLIATLKEIEQDPEYQATALERGMNINMMYDQDFVTYIDGIEKTMIELKPLFGWN